MSVSLLEAKANFVEWCKSFLNTHVDYKKDMPFDIDFVAKAIWKKIENSYENLLYLEEQNVALRGEADTNAALSIKHKMLAYELKAENAALRERLSKAVELPCIEPMTTWGWDDKKGITKEHFDDYYQLIYRDKDGEFICTPGLKKEEAEAQLKELKGENQSAEEGKSETET